MTSDNIDINKKKNDGSQQPLLTSTSVALSLSPPRIPPHNTNLRRLYTTNYHPHLPTSLSLPDKLTRFIGSTLSIESQHKFRDNGYFRAVANGAVKLSCPLIGLGHLKEVREFVELSTGRIDEDQQQQKQIVSKEKIQRRRRWSKRRIPYGEHHPMQYIDLFLPSSPRDTSTSNNNNIRIPIRGTIFFVHGGAWGSGEPWMYRLISPTFLELNFAVVIVGYRTYPDAQDIINDQCNDIKLAWELCEGVLNELVIPISSSSSSSENGDSGWVGNVICGHSSGAHIALIFLVDWIGEQMKKKKKKNGIYAADSRTRTARHYNTGTIKYPWTPDYFIGLSGPYDISYHFDYEGGRGVEQISPLKPICGHTRENFDRASPAKRLYKLLASEGKKREQGLTTTASASVASIMQQYMPSILLVHGIEDTTVPFTATSDLGRVLRSCGLHKCDEMYLEDTGHQDVIMQFMLGGRAKDLVLDWLLKCRNNTQEEEKEEEELASQIQSRL